MSTLVIGDIHGCLREFDSLLEKCKYTQGKDELILLGDLLDRGPDSPGVVKRAIELGAKCVKGNHEESALRYINHELKKISNPEYKNPMRKRTPERMAEWARIPTEHWKWLAGLPLFIRFGNGCAALHAGCMPNKPLEEQDPSDLMRLRYIHNITGKRVPLEDGNEPPDSHFWHDDWTGPEFVIYGHHVHPEVHMSRNGLALGIDTGGCFGGKLTAAVFEDGEFAYIVDVPAEKEYSPIFSSWINTGA